MDESPFYATDSGKGKLNIHLSAKAELESDIAETRSVTQEIVPPDASLFQIRLSSADGSYVKTWSSIEEFEKEENFSIGTYSVEAFYGSASSQGIVEDSEKGYEHAYYYAVDESVAIESDITTAVKLEAKLANSIVLIEYTEAFKKYFKDWETILKTEGAYQIPLGNKECLTYIKSGKVNLTIKAELQNGNLVRMTPASFEAEPQHLYKIRYNVNNGQIGETDKLQIIFNDDLDNENNIEIDLTDELFTGEVPIITLEGLEQHEDASLEMLEGYPFEESLKFIINAHEGIRSAILYLESEDHIPGFMSEGEIEFFGADDATQQTLINEGIRVLGIYNDPDKLALIDVTDFCRNLPIGNYTIGLKATDKYGREGEPVSFNLTVCPVDVRLSLTDSGNGLGIIEFGDEEAEVMVSYNGPMPELDGPFSFKVAGKLLPEDVDIISVTASPITRSFESKDYIFRIKLPKYYRDEYPVSIYYRDMEVKNQDVTLTVKYSAYEVEYDRVADILMLMFKSGTDEKIQEAGKDHLGIFVDGKRISPSQISYDDSDGVFTVTGLPEGESQKVKTTICTGDNPSYFSDETEVRKKIGEPVPNGDFENIDKDNPIYLKLFRGGVYRPRGTALNEKQDDETYNENVPEVWATVNQKTCYYDSKVKNTWFIVPSTIITEGKKDNGILIRSVGYDYEGKTIPRHDGSLSNVLDYSEKIPDKGNTAAGKLFLGSYDIDIQNYTIVSESYNQGYPFNSRPVKLKGYYKYKPYDNERGKANIAIKKKDGEVLAKGEYFFEEAGDWTEFEIPLETEYTFKNYPDFLEIMFMSSENGSDSWEVENNQVPTQAIHKYTQKFIGSELSIDELTFEY